MCRPEPGQTELVIQEDELLDARWMPLNEYAAIPFQSSTTMHKQILDCCLLYASGEYLGMMGQKLISGSDGRKDLLVLANMHSKSSL
jgi:hypothetical protein